MHETSWLHELILGALAGNIAIGLGLIKLIFKAYKQYDAFMHRHHLMWQYYCKIHRIKMGREFDDRSSEDSVS